MRRRAFFAALLAALCGLSGCKPSSSAPTPTPLTKEELEAYMAKRLDLKDLTLTGVGGGRFTGTGKMAEGQVMEIEVVQEERRLSWKNKWESNDAKGWKGQGSGSGSVSR